MILLLATKRVRSKPFGPDGVKIVLVITTMAKNRISIGHPAQVLCWYLSELCLHRLDC